MDAVKGARATAVGIAHLEDHPAIVAESTRASLRELVGTATTGGRLRVIFWGWMGVQGASALLFSLSAVSYLNLV